MSFVIAAKLGLLVAMLVMAVISASYLVHSINYERRSEAWVAAVLFSTSSLAAAWALRSLV